MGDLRVDNSSNSDNEFSFFESAKKMGKEMGRENNNVKVVKRDEKKYSNQAIW